MAAARVPVLLVASVLALVVLAVLRGAAGTARDGGVGPEVRALEDAGGFADQPAAVGATDELVAPPAAESLADPVDSPGGAAEPAGGGSRAPAKYVGRFVDAAGDPVEVARVEAFQEHSDGELDPRRLWLEPRSGGSRVESSDEAVGTADFVLDASELRSAHQRTEDRYATDATVHFRRPRERSREGMASTPGPPLFARVRLPAAAEGVHELGTIVLAARPPLVTGLVVDERGLPLADACVSLLTHAEDLVGVPRTEEDWAPAASPFRGQASTYTDADGGFALYEDFGREVLALRASALGRVQPDAPRAFTRGERGVRLVLVDATVPPELAGRVQGFVALPEGAGRPDLVLTVRPEDRVPDARTARAVRVVPPAFPPIELPAGTYTLELRPDPDAEPWCAVRVTIEAGELHTVRLPDLAHLRVLRLVEPPGARAGDLRWALPGGAWSRTGWAQVEPGTWALVTDAEALRVRWREDASGAVHEQTFEVRPEPQPLVADGAPRR